MLDSENEGKVNYREFMKYSYMCHMYIHIYNLEYHMKESDTENKGMVTVGQLKDILETKEHFNFPVGALDLVFQEMLQQKMDKVDPACLIKIDAFLQSLKTQFEKQ